MSDVTINWLKLWSRVRFSKRISRLSGSVETAVSSSKDYKRQKNVQCVLIQRLTLKFGLKTTNQPNIFFYFCGQTFKKLSCFSIFTEVVCWFASSEMFLFENLTIIAETNLTKIKVFTRCNPGCAIGTGDIIDFR